MRIRSLLLALIPGFFALTLRADDQLLCTSPKGDFTIMQVGESQDWVVSTSNTTQREKLGPPSDLGPGTYVISPDENWIVSQIHIGSGMSGAALFRHKQGLRFVPFTGEKGRLDDLLSGFHDHVSGRKAGEDETNMVDFVSFSPDSSRILFSLRGGEKRGAGFYGWLVYLNTRTGKLEQTAYLKAKSRGSEKRWTDDDLRDKWPEPASAEPVDPLPDEAQLKSRWQDSDGKLNAVYAKLRSHLKKDEKELMQKEQRAWLIARDAGTAEYAKAGEPNTQAQRHWQFMADSTDSRIEALETQFSRGENQ